MHNTKFLISKRKVAAVGAAHEVEGVSVVINAVAVTAIVSETD